jgi:K+-sensing histidine kinase KdpD
MSSDCSLNQQVDYEPGPYSGNRDELLRLRQQLADAEAEREYMHQQLQAIETRNRRIEERFTIDEQRCSELATLLVASRRLQGTLDPQEIATAIEEIIVNLIGSEEFGVFEISQDGSSLIPIAHHHHGIAPPPLCEIPVGNGTLGTVFTTGEAVVEPGNDGRDGEPIACIPLKVDGRVTGVIAIFSLLPHKGGALDELDLALLDTLSTQAGVALRCAHLQQLIDGAVE